MRRVIGVLIAALAACGCAAHKTAFAPNLTAPTTFQATTTTIILPEGTWTFGSGGAGFVEGEMHLRGGPPSGGKPKDQPVPGVVEVHHPGRARVLTKVTVGRTGRFKIALPAGNYELIGRPTNTGVMSMTSNVFVINVGQTVKVDLLELAA